MHCFMASIDKLLLVGVLVMAFVLIILVIGDASVSGLTVGEIMPGGSVSLEKGGEAIAKRGILSFTLGILVLTIIVVVVAYFVHRKVE